MTRKKQAKGKTIRMRIDLEISGASNDAFENITDGMGAAQGDGALLTAIELALQKRGGCTLEGFRVSSPEPEHRGITFEMDWPDEWDLSNPVPVEEAICPLCSHPGSATGDHHMCTVTDCECPQTVKDESPGASRKNRELGGKN